MIMHPIIELNQAVVEINDHSSKKISPKRRIRSVRFNTERNELHEVEKADSQLRDYCWVSKEEFKMMRQRDDVLCQLAKIGKFQGDDDHSLRGLESRLECREKPSSTSAVRSVLREQRHQRREGVSCSLSLSLISSRASQQARFRALSLGLHDADEASQYLRRR